MQQRCTVLCMYIPQLCVHADVVAGAYALLLLLLLLDRGKRLVAKKLQKLTKICLVVHPTLAGNHQ